MGGIRGWGGGDEQGHGVGDQEKGREGGEAGVRSRIGGANVVKLGTYCGNQLPGVI